MNAKNPHLKVREIRQDESDFMLNDGMVMYPRAMLHILPECPTEVRHTIQWAVTNGYVKFSSHVKESELVWERLQS